MNRKVHVRFLGEGTVATPPPYPTAEIQSLVTYNRLTAISIKAILTVSNIHSIQEV